MTSSVACVGVLSECVSALTFETSASRLQHASTRRLSWGHTECLTPHTGTYVHLGPSWSHPRRRRIFHLGPSRSHLGCRRICGVYTRVRDNSRASGGDRDKRQETRQIVTGTSWAVFYSAFAASVVPEAPATWTNTRNMLVPRIGLAVLVGASVAGTGT